MKRRTRNDPRKEATRAAIIECAESLFALHGIEAVSLRQIGASIGSYNTSVVAYHFGDKQSLVEAIFHHRLPAIDARRLCLLEELPEGCTDEVLTLLRALWLPLWEQVNSEGRHSYAGFLSALTYSSLAQLRMTVRSDYPVSNEIGKRLKKALPSDLRSSFDSRMIITTLMMTGVLKVIDETAQSKNSLSLFEDTLRMAAAGITAPTVTKTGEN